MNPLLRSDFEQIDKNFIKKLRRKIINHIIIIRRKNRIYDHKTIYNFSYFHVFFSLIFLLLPFIFFIFKFSDLLKDEKSYILDNFLSEKFSENKYMKPFLRNFTNFHNKGKSITDTLLLVKDFGNLRNLKNFLIHFSGILITLYNKSITNLL